jgi:hypothetical protein
MTVDCRPLTADCRLREVVHMLALRWLAQVIGVAALAVAVGCSGGNTSGSYATVSGFVTHGGAPVDGATVTFHSTVEVDGKKEGPYSATTDSSGKYLLARAGKDPGIPPGLYKVTITKYNPRGVNLPPDFDQGQIDASGMGSNVLPKSYETLALTKLSVTLETGKNENKNFDLQGEASGSSPPRTP